jgi:hypothetical protein
MIGSTTWCEYLLPGWWFGTCVFFHILGISYSQLTNILQRGRYTTNQFAVISSLFLLGSIFPSSFSSTHRWCCHGGLTQTMWAVFICVDCQQEEEVGIPIQSLVGGLEHVLFSIIYGIILPINSYFSSFFYCTTNQNTYINYTIPIRYTLWLFNIAMV